RTIMAPRNPLAMTRRGHDLGAGWRIGGAPCGGLGQPASAAESALLRNSDQPAQPDLAASMSQDADDSISAVARWAFRQEGVGRALGRFALVSLERGDIGRLLEPSPGGIEK